MHSQSLPPDDSAPPEVVSAAEPTGPASHAPEATSGPDIAAAESGGGAVHKVHAEEEPEREPKGIAVAVEDDDRPVKMDWYILKVQSNREDSIREGLLRRVQVAGLEKYFGDVIVPIETVTEFKGGKKKVVKRKLYPGYLVVRMEINDDTWYLVRETPGIGDFTGSIGRPSPMAPQDVAKILSKTEEKTDEAPRLEYSREEGGPRQNQRRHLREFRRRGGHDQRSQRPRDCDHQHFRPADAGRIGALANRTGVNYVSRCLSASVS